MQLHYENYFALEPLVRTGNQTIHTSEITAQNWNQYYTGCLNLMKDGIEDVFVQKSKIRIVFPDGKGCNLTIIDFFFNCIMWYMIVMAGRPIEKKHLFFNKAITNDNIKDYIDRHVIKVNREIMPSKNLNNMIDDSLFKYMDVDNFSLFLGSTINLEDFRNLMKASPRFNELMHADLSNVPIEDVKTVGMKLANEAIDIILKSKDIMGYEHCLADTFRAKEGTNKMQFKEFAVSIGSKPDGLGGAYPVAVNSSYLNGGLNTLLYQFIDSAASRYAQIITKNNVGDSGNFARILGWNSIDTILRDDPDYICNTKNFLRIEVKNKKILERFRDRWFRKDPEGVEYLCDGEDESLIGQTLYFRSPEFCESQAHGNGVCFRCYGKLAYNNRYKNIGKMAAELITAILTQMRLSAKHLLETKIKKFDWNESFRKFMEVNDNVLFLNNNLEFSPKWFIMIDPNDIAMENELDYDSVDYADIAASEEKDDDDFKDETESDFNEYVCRFYIGNEAGEVFEIAGSQEQYHMYITTTLNKLIRTGKIAENGMIKITFDEAESAPLFCLKIDNDELGNSLDDIKHLIDKKPITSMHDAHSLTQAVLEAAIDGKINVMAVHFEVLIMNQIRSIVSNLKKPDWNNPNEPYKVLTLKEALNDNPSVTISMIYQNLSRLLVRPLTYKKTAPSFVDVFFMREPQNFMTDKSNLIDTSVTPKKVKPFIRVHKRK